MFSIMESIVMKQQSNTFSFSVKIRQCLSDIMYGLFRASLVGIFRVFFRVRIVGRHYCPKNGGPLLVVSNHISEWDPPFVGSCLPWQVHWLAKTELFELLKGKMNGFFRMLHCIPVDREQVNLATIKYMVHLLKGKRPVVVFAEGGVRRNETSVLGSNPQLKEGAASMAILADCEILPVIVNGTFSAYRWQNWLSFRRPMFEIIIGPVFKPKGRDRTQVTQEILQRLLDLKPQLKQSEIC